MDAPRDPVLTAEPRARWVSRHWPQVMCFIAVALAVALGGLVAARVDGEPLPMDAAWLALLNENRTDTGDAAASALSLLGGGVGASVIIPGVVITALLLARRRWGAGYVLVATVLAGVAVQLLKQSFARDRPPNAVVNLDFGSFPSGHVTNAAVVATVLALLVPRVWVWVAGGVYTMLMMLSRTYLAAHWLSDTLGAVLLGVGVAGLVGAPFAARLEGERALAAARPSVWRPLRGRISPMVIERRGLAPGVRRRLVVAAITVGSLGVTGGVVLLVSVLAGHGLTVLDKPVLDLMLDWRTPALTAMMTALAVTFGPIGLPIIVLVVSVTWGIIARHAWRPLLLVAGMVLGVALGQIIGRVVDRQRPPVDLMLLGPDASFSFPSGHVLGAADFVLITAYLVLSRRRDRRGAPLASVLVAVGIVLAALSRIYLGYHWVTDVLASVALSLVVLGCVICADVWWGGRLESGSPRPGEAVEAVGDESDADRA